MNVISSETSFKWIFVLESSCQYKYKLLKQQIRNKINTHTWRNKKQQRQNYRFPNKVLCYRDFQIRTVYCILHNWRYIGIRFKWHNNRDNKIFQSIKTNQILSHWNIFSGKQWFYWMVYVDEAFEIIICTPAENSV